MRIAQETTSIEAYHAHVGKGKAVAQRTRIMELISERGGDWCIGEIANALNMKDNIVSARVNELLYETRELVVYPPRKSIISKITVRPVGLPAAQKELFQ